MKIETDDDPLTTSTFETKLHDYSVEFVMSLDYPSDFNDSRVSLQQRRRLDRDDVKELVEELQKWLATG